MTAIIQKVKRRFRGILPGILLPALCVFLLLKPAETRQSNSAQLTWPVTYPEYFIEDYILEGTVIIQEDERALELIRDMSSAGLRVTRNAIFARNGFTFESPDLDHYFSRQRWYPNRDEPVSLSRADSLNVAFILELEQKTPDLPDFDALFTDASYNGLREVDFGPANIHGSTYIPAVYVRDILGKPHYAFEFDYTVYAPLKKFTLRDNETLYLFTVNYRVGQTINAIIGKSDGDFSPTFDLEIFLGDQEVGGDTPIIEESRLFVTGSGTLYTIQVQSQDKDIDINGESRYITRQGLIVRGHRVQNGKLMEIRLDREDTENVFSILHNEVSEAVKSLMEKEPEMMTYYPIKEVLTKALWIIKKDDSDEIVKLLKPLHETFSSAFEEAILHYQPYEQAILRDAVK